jgi:hypothetical protein
MEADEAEHKTSGEKWSDWWDGRREKIAFGAPRKCLPRASE